MRSIADATTPVEATLACALAEQRVKEWARARYPQAPPSGEDLEAFAYANFDAAAASPPRELLENVWLLPDALSGDECDTVLGAVEEAARRRGGWDKDRHGQYPTTDMPLGDVPEIEPLLREAIFRNVLRPLAHRYLPPPFLPEHLEWRDAFFVKYDAAPGQQRQLHMHTDGSIFSFNLLLNHPDDFDGGGTFFEPTGQTVRPPRGTAVGHSGQVRHSGVAITRGKRYLFVGFIGCAQHAFPMRGAGWQAAAAREAFLKFGKGAWERGAHAEPRLVVWEHEQVAAPPPPPPMLRGGAAPEQRQVAPPPPPLGPGPIRMPPPPAKVSEPIEYVAVD